MERVPQVAQILSQVLESEINNLARETGRQQRKGTPSGADGVQTLMVGWVQEPGLTLDGMAQGVTRREVFVSSSGFNQRFTQEGRAGQGSASRGAPFENEAFAHFLSRPSIC